MKSLIHMRIDPLIVLILTAVATAAVLPASGWFADAFDTATKIAIALLFFLYGARLSPAEAGKGLTHWRLHLTILTFTFIVFPTFGLGLVPLRGHIAEGLYLGLVYVTLVPSTVQSSVAFTSIARGNVAGAIVSASASNLIGVVATPLLVMLLMRGSGGSAIAAIDGHVFINIAVQLLLPFFLGQVLRRWVKNFAANKATKIVDRGSITMVVYAAFSHGMTKGIWQMISVQDVVALIIFAIIVIAFMLWFTGWVATKLGFSRADKVAIQFCGTKKSLATGLPMASVIFGTGQIGLLILPLMIFHQIQLMICAWLAGRWASQVATTDTDE